MKRQLIGGFAALALTCGAGALGGCGSQSKPASVASAPASTQTTPTDSVTTTSTPTRTTTTTSPSAGSAPAPASSSGGTSTPSTTRTAPEPAFTESEAHTEGLEEAVGALQARGYAPDETGQYHPNQTLRVLVGTKSGGDEQQAFFFVDGRYIGTDAKEPSGAIKVVSQSDTEVTLAYALYRPQDPLASPSGGQATVRFALNDGKLMALDAIPPASSSTGLSRR